MLLKKILLIIVLTFVTNAFSQKSKTNLYGGITLPIGAELGVINETELPKIKVLKLAVKSSIIWTPVSHGNDKINSLLIAGLQPGLRLKLINNHLILSGGISVNPVAALPFNGLDFGMGLFAGTSFTVKKVELGLYATRIYGKEIFIDNIGWLSFVISRNFPD